MTDFPDTSYSLLAQLRTDSERQAWKEFVEIYRPVIYRIARRKNLQDADAQDLTQQIMLSILGSLERWEKANDHVRFRHWLRRVCKNAAINALSRKPIDLADGGTVANDMLSKNSAPQDSVEDLFQLERRRELFSRASRIVQGDVDPTTWQAFELTAIHRISVKEVSAKLNKSVGTIYAARSRIMKRLQDEVAELERIEQ